MEKANIDRINELARLARERDLTPEEAAERHQRRQKYLEAFRANFRNQLEHTVIQREDGTREPLKKKKLNPQKQNRPFSFSNRFVNDFVNLN